jgi:putative hydrolase of the HAD superfamily
MHDLILANNRGLISPEESNTGIAALLGVSPEELRTRIDQGEVKDQRLLDYVAELHSRYKTGLLSNISASGLKRRFEAGELERYFDAVIVSGDIGYAKPEAQAYEAIVDQLDVRLDECLFIDDREEYCEGAQGVGMQAICYESLDQCRRDVAKITLM